MIVREDIKDLLPIIEEQSKKAKFVLEIGCANGDGSTIAFTNVMKQSKQKDKLYISVDIVDLIFPEYRPNNSWWHLVLGDSRKLETLEEVRKISGDILADIIFIDTEHNYPIMEKELEVWKNIAHEKTVWLFHDTWMSGNYNHMTDAIKQFADRNPMWKYVDLTKENNGLGALIPV